MVYKTKDFYLACVLLSNGFKLISSEKDSIKNSCTVFFIFDIAEKEELKDRLVNEFINQECYVNVKKFAWAMSIIRQEIHKYK